ncbi:hypothetical protein BCV70DRAFT_195845 [Testicularia cyperi]|uniref:Uncharacterized protein n=1 Tax=Testicularia cyperi TaxID=1882483 RepID=A0A317XGJ8_9BASI|nr:hypothetical protein BCV70DRAFT_195845 [Testicularia cyperi]
MARPGAPLTAAAKRYLSTLEAQWSGSIHLRMLGAPIRKCGVTNKAAPASLLFQIKSVTLPPTQPFLSKALSDGTSEAQPKNPEGNLILPDRILHPKYAAKKPGKGMWITLSPTILQQLYLRGTYKMLNPKATLPPELGVLVHTQLGERVIQEVELLRSFLASPPEQSADLTAEEQTPPSHPQPRLSFTLSTDIPAQDDPSTEQDTSMSHSLPLQFRPLLASEAQHQRLCDALSGLPRFKTSPSSSTLYSFPEIQHTANLGIALYRLHLWTRTPNQT